MKKFTLFAAMAAVAMGAAAQYNCEPSIHFFDDKEGYYIIDAIQMSDVAQSYFEGKGFPVSYALAVNDVTNNLWIWEGTFDGGVNTNGAVGADGESDFLCLQVTNKGWSGLGMNINNNPEAVLTHLTEETHVHFSLWTNNAPASLDLQLFADAGKAIVSVGTQPGEGALIGDFENGKWVGFDISFANLKKLCPKFDWTQGVNPYNGNFYCILAGGVQGRNFGLDSFYFYTPATPPAGVEDVEVSENAPVVFYNLQGVKVENPSNGLYIRTQGKKVEKVLVK